MSEPIETEVPAVEVLDAQKDGNITLREFSDDEVFKLTQSARYALVQEMTRHGKPPTDFERGTLFLSTLDSMDKQVINRAKLKIEDEKAQSDDQWRNLMISVLNDSSFKDATIANGVGAGQATGEFELPPEVTQFKQVPGQGEIAAPQIEYSDIMEGKKNDD